MPPLDLSLLDDVLLRLALAAGLPWVLGATLERLMLRWRRASLAVAAGVTGRGLGLLAMLRVVQSEPAGVRTLAALVAALLGVFAVLRAARLTQDGLAHAERAHVAMVAGKAIRYGGLVLLVAVVASAAGWDLTAALATAGVVGVAVGFASQTSLSNVIAGVFLLVDHPFEVGDTVEVDGQIGTVESITLLSTRVRTFDNLLVRWPNEWVLKARIVNYSSHEVRRLEVILRLPFGTDLPAVRDAVLSRLDRAEPLLLEPAPDVRFRDLADNGISAQVRAWVPRDGVLDGRDALVMETHHALEHLGVRPIVPRYQTDLPPDAPG